MADEKKPVDLEVKAVAKTKEDPSDTSEKTLVKIAEEPSSDLERILDNMEAEEFNDRVQKGEIVLPREELPDIDKLFTPERIEAFILGDITWAQLQGMTIEEAYALAEMGYGLFEEGKFAEARVIFEGLVLCNPYDSYFHNMLGAIYQSLDMEEEALISYTEAIELDTDNLHARVNRAELLLKDGEFDKALDDLKCAIEIDPEGSDPASVRARALAMATANAMDALREILDKAEASKKDDSK